MDEKSEGGRENGGGNDTNDTKEEGNILAADSGDTENGVVQNVADDIKTEDPEAEPGRKTTSEEQSEKVPSESDGAQTKVEFQLPENASGVETTAGEEVKELDDEAQIATKDNNISQGKTNKTNASNSEKQPNPDCSQADPGTDQVETSRTVQYQDGVDPQTAADSPPELATNKAITEPSYKTPDAPTAQSIIRNNMEDSTSNGTQEAVPSSGSGKTGTKESGEPPKADPPTAPHEGSVKTDEGGRGERQIADLSTVPREVSGKTDKEEESGKPKIADFSSEPIETRQKTELDKFPVPSDEEALVDTPVIIPSSFGRPGLRNPTTNLTPADQNSGSKDPKDKEGARKRKTKEKSEEEKRATENKANEQKDSKEGAAAIIKCTKGDETTKQRVDEKKVEHIIKKRPVSISVCTSAYEFNVQGLVSFLKDLKKDHPELIKEVKVHALPYNDLDHYTFPKDHPIDVMLLCHSINNRRFAITDVLDALYDKYLPYCARVVGKNKMGVIVHDFDDMRETVQASRMGSFSYKQPKAFETTSLQIICGHIEKKEQVLHQMQKADREKVLEFLKNASTFPEQMMEQVTESQSLLKEGLTKKGTSSGTYQTPQASVDEMNLNPPRDESPLGQQRPGTSNMAASAHTRGLLGKQSVASRRTVTAALQMPSPRRISVSVCSSAYEHKVKGLLSNLTELQAGVPHMFADVRFRSLPYNDIDSFRFPSNDPVDVMVLCHSVQNRGFSITNVLNALYEKYLQYCHDVIGKKKLAVIVHDFSDCKPKTLDVRMESFRRSQPLTFELADTVIVCGSLEKPGKIEMRDEDMRRLTTFFAQARYEQKENYAVKQSLKKSFLGMPLPWK